MNPFALMALNMQMASLMVEAQTVVALRVMGMSGAIPASTDENALMINEKSTAIIDAYSAGTKAAMEGKTPDQIMSAAMEPVSRKVTANRKRLMK